MLFKKKIYIKRSNNYHWKTVDNNNYIDDVAIFGGGHKTIISDNFKGGNITAVFSAVQKST